MSCAGRDEGDVVTDPERQELAKAEPEAMRPIPDGGLRDAMPEWLRRPPAWRNLPKRAEPDTPVATSPEAKERELPEPDTSEIDPRSLVDISDLPQWLQDLAARSDAVSRPPVITDEPASDATEENVMKEPEKQGEGRVEDVRTVSFEPVDKKKWAVPEEETKVYGGPKPTGMSQQMMMGLGLIALGILLIILFAFVL
jgi:hypothetical protein